MIDALIQSYGPVAGWVYTTVLGPLGVPTTALFPIACLVLFFGFHYVVGPNRSALAGFLAWTICFMLIQWPQARVQSHAVALATPENRAAINASAELFFDYIGTGLVSILCFVFFVPTMWAVSGRFGCYLDEPFGAMRPSSRRSKDESWIEREIKKSQAEQERMTQAAIIQRNMQADARA
jgi:hypothetical protein